MPSQPLNNASLKSEWHGEKGQALRCFSPSLCWPSLGKAAETKKTLRRRQQSGDRQLVRSGFQWLPECKTANVGENTVGKRDSITELYGAKRFVKDLGKELYSSLRPCPPPSQTLCHSKSFLLLGTKRYSAAVNNLQYLTQLRMHLPFSKPPSLLGIWARRYAPQTWKTETHAEDSSLWHYLYKQNLGNNRSVRF